MTTTADVASPPASTGPAAAAKQPRGQPMKIQTPETNLPPVDKLRKQYQALDFTSPVNQNGSFEFDRIIKSGTCLKRTRKTKNWKPVYIVLRPNLVSIYKDSKEKKLRHQLDLSELTAVARQRDPKQKALHVFGLFSPSRNYHLDAASEKEAQEWVELIRREARIDEEEEEMILLSPTITRETAPKFPIFAKRDIASSSSDNAPVTARPPSASKARPVRRPSYALTYSGNEQGSYSDFSDTGFGNGTGSFQNSSTSLPPSNKGVNTGDSAVAAARAAGADAVYGISPQPPELTRDASHLSGLATIQSAGGVGTDDERVICHGWLYLLKSKGGVRQWKKVWIVLRPKGLAIYKNEEEYSASLVLPFTSVLDAVELDPISRSKRFCMQVIAEERGYRFCASNEDDLARWLGAFKSLLARRKEMGLGVTAVRAGSPPVTVPASAPPAAGPAAATLAKGGGGKGGGAVSESGVRSSGALAK